MGTFGDSWSVFRAALRMIGEDTAFLAVPVLCALTLIGIFAVFTVPLLAVFLAAPTSFAWLVTTTPGVALLAVAFLALYFLLTITGNFFAAALIGMAMIRLEGGQPTLTDGLRFARSHLSRIILWSLIAGTVGLLIRVISSRFRGFGGFLLQGVVGATWAVATYFALPVILYENAGVWVSLRRSATLFIKTSGRSVVTNVLVVVFALALGIAGAALVVVGVWLAFHAVSTRSPWGSPSSWPGWPRGSSTP